MNKSVTKLVPCIIVEGNMAVAELSCWTAAGSSPVKYIIVNQCTVYSISYSRLPSTFNTVWCWISTWVDHKLLWPHAWKEMTLSN